MPRSQPSYVPFVSSVREPKSNDSHSCPICADSIIAAETSFYRADGSITYVWSCETCGYGFVTTHHREPIACH